MWMTFKNFAYKPIAEQLEAMEAMFAITPYPSYGDRQTLVNKTKIPEARIQVGEENYF